MKDRDKKWIHEGFITESLSNGMFRVRLDNEDRSETQLTGGCPNSELESEKGLCR